MEYTDELIATLIGCLKKITKPPSKNLKPDRGHLKNNFEVESEDGEHSFTCFIRVNEKFLENFSVGLDYVPKDEPGNVMLLRCNGPHGPHKVHDHHTFCHIHKATAETISKGLKPESNIEVTDGYSSYQEAIQYFLKLANIRDDEHFFPTTQLSLFQS
ncbi:MAG: hypothetical protein HYZ34_13095 [Ignavibacteriae bacterium]|nr:hypothetical protein [Ignavibacteriota bacterium]